MNMENNDSYVIFLQLIGCFLFYLIPVLFIIGIIIEIKKKTVTFESIKKEKILGCGVVRINGISKNLLLITTLKEVYFLSIKDNYKLCKSSGKLEKIETKFDKDDSEFLINLDNSDIHQSLFNYKFCISFSTTPFHINIEIIN